MQEEAVTLQRPRMEQELCVFREQKGGRMHGLRPVRGEVRMDAVTHAVLHLVGRPFGVGKPEESFKTEEQNDGGSLNDFFFF